MSAVSWLNLTGGPGALPLEDGRALRLLTAQEILDARREAETLCRDGRERALCSNACLLARALTRRGRAEYPDGAAVLAALTVEQIAALSARWSAFAREADPGLESGKGLVDALKKAWSTRRRNGCAGVCSGPSGPCPRSGGSGRCTPETTSGAR